MRKFTSYGPVDIDMNYYAPRTGLIEKTYLQLIGENPQKSGHYFTVWASRQTGKTWLMQQILHRLKKDSRFHTLKINLEILKRKTNVGEILEILAKEIGKGLDKTFDGINDEYKFQELFSREVIEKPLILILDEFDAIDEKGINAIVSVFRNIYIHRRDEFDKTTEQKTYLLHGVALIGVRSVLGIENEKGSPFNVQRSVHVSNLTYEEVAEMFKWYEKESGQIVEEEVIRVVYDEMRGQPGLTCWLGELLTETYNPDPTRPITMANFDEAYGAATHILPNNNILNIISKVDKSPYDEAVMELFETNEKTDFTFDDKNLNYLYMNGVITEDKVSPKEYYVKFSCPFVQKRIFNFFSRRFFKHLGQLVHPLDAMEDAVDEENLYIPNIIKRYQAYLTKNQGVFFKDVPRRKTDMGIYEAIFHFNLFRYLYDLLKKRGVEVVPEFPTGNGKIDLILKYRKNTYALELKSFSDMADFQLGIDQAANYGVQMGLKRISFVIFVELSPTEVKQLEKEVEKNGIRVEVLPIGIL